MLAQTGEKPGVNQIGFAEALARHSFTNEYIWAQTDSERALLEELKASICKKIDTGRGVSAFELFMVGAYEPLGAIPSVRNWVLKLGRRNLSTLDPTLRLLVFNGLLEETVQIEALTPIAGEVSAKVQEQYEENPYPRWRHLQTPCLFNGLRSYAINSIGGHKVPSNHDPARPKILIAGSGTGQHPIDVAQSLPSASVLAVDLSRSSLAYASRETTERGVANVAFVQADILDLSGIDYKFDLIESMGVLHHMEDPEAGLKVLVDLLKPGGYLKLGLYSKAARCSVNAARNHFSKANYIPGVEGIRVFRQELINSDDPTLKPLLRFRDFYSTSEFRDLVMHAQEHQFSIPQIGKVLKQNGLKFLGFSSPDPLAILEKMPQKKAQRRVRDLEAWDKYEKRHPDTFKQMYQFMCVKR